MGTVSIQLICLSHEDKLSFRQTAGGVRSDVDRVWGEEGVVGAEVIAGMETWRMEKLLDGGR